MHQVAVGGVDLDEVEAGPLGACRGLGEGVHDDGDVRPVEGLGRGVLAEGDVGRRHGLPAAVGRVHAAVPVVAPLRPHRRLAAGVGELDAGRGALRVDEGDDARPGRGLLAVPDAGVLVGDATVGNDGRGLGDDEPGTAHGHGAEVGEVPVVRNAVLLRDRVLAERRHPEAVADRERAHGDGLEQC